MSAAKKTSVFDGLMNLMTGMGILARDRSKSAIYVKEPRRGEDELEAMYREDWIARKIVEIVPHDMTRKGRVLRGDEALTEKIYRLESDLDVWGKIAHALRLKRLYGGGAIVIHTGGSLSSAVDPASLGKNCIKAMHAVSSYNLRVKELNWDIRTPDYGKPYMYELTQRISGVGRYANKAREEEPLYGNIDIHPSRVIPFRGEFTSDIHQDFDEWWGDSILQATYQAIQNATRSSTVLGQLLEEAKMDVVSIANLSTKLSTMEGERNLFSRWAAYAQSKSINGILMLDKDTEDYSQKQLSLTGLSDIMNVFLVMVSGAVDIPATRFLNQSPTGLNSTGESDLRNYYNAIESRQETELRSAFDKLDRFLFAHEFGDAKPPMGYWFDFVPLWTPTPVELVQMEAQAAQAISVYAQSNILDAVALQKGVESRLYETGFLPGFAAAMKEVKAEREAVQRALAELGIESPGSITPRGEPGDDGEGPGGDPILPSPAGSGPPNAPDPAGSSLSDGVSRPSVSRFRVVGGMDARPIASRASDAPKSLYAYRPLLNGKAVRRWMEKQGFETGLEWKDMHVTLAYSKAEVDWNVFRQHADITGRDKNIIVRGGARRVARLGEDAVVLMFEDERLVARHSDFMQGGASHDFDKFIPHVTLTYKFNGDLSQISPYTGPLEFGPERFEEINPSYTDELIERAFDYDPNQLRVEKGKVEGGQFTSPGKPDTPASEEEKRYQAEKLAIIGAVQKWINNGMPEDERPSDAALELYQREYVFVPWDQDKPGLLETEERAQAAARQIEQSSEREIQYAAEVMQEYINSGGMMELPADISAEYLEEAYYRFNQRESDQRDVSELVKERYGELMSEAEYILERGQTDNDYADSEKYEWVKAVFLNENPGFDWDGAIEFRRYLALDRMNRYLSALSNGDPATESDFDIEETDYGIWLSVNGTFFEIAVADARRSADQLKSSHREIFDEMFGDLDEDSRRDLTDALRAYTGRGSIILNEYLRGLDAPNYYSNTYKKYLKDMRSGFDQAALPSEIVVYRSLTDKQRRRIEDALANNSDLVDYGFLSTTSNPNFRFKDPNFRIILPEGAPAIPIQHLSRYENESEVLIADGSRFKVERDDEWTYTLRWVGREKPKVNVAFDYDPNQLRAPEGKSEGGQWIKPATPLTPAQREREKFEQAKARLQKQPKGFVNFEVAPDPNDTELVNKWRKLDNSKRLMISNEVASQVVPDFMTEIEASGEMLDQVGSYLDDTNPSFALKIEEGDPLEIARGLGHALSQDSMMVLAADPFDGSFEANLVEVRLDDTSTEQVEAVYQLLRTIRQADGRNLVSGQSTSDGRMKILLDNQDNPRVAVERIDRALDGRYEVLLHKVHAAFPSKEEYGYANSRSDAGGNAGPYRQSVDNARQKAARLLAQKLASVSADARSRRTGTLSLRRTLDFNPNQLRVEEGKSEGGQFTSPGKPTTPAQKEREDYERVKAALAAGQIGGQQSVINEKERAALRAKKQAELLALLDKAEGATPEQIEQNAFFREALLASEQIPSTSERDGYGTPEDLANRVYNFNGEKVVGTEEALDRLVQRAEVFGWSDENLEPPEEPVKYERKAWVVIGPPAAGKSTIANPIARDNNAAIIDADDAKKVLPEFAGGIGAGATHNESSDLAAKVRSIMIAQGANIVMPRVGDDASKMEQLIKDLKSQGYQVNLVHMKVKETTAMKRMVKRFIRTGRLISARYLGAVNGNPDRTYAHLRSLGIADGYVQYDAEADGQKPVVVESTGTAKIKI